jgi:hypothetical protein
MPSTRSDSPQRGADQHVQGECPRHEGRPSWGRTATPGEWRTAGLVHPVRVFYKRRLDCRSDGRGLGPPGRRGGIDQSSVGSSYRLMPGWAATAQPERRNGGVAAPDRVVSREGIQPSMSLGVRRPPCRRSRVGGELGRDALEPRKLVGAGGFQLVKQTSPLESPTRPPARPTPSAIRRGRPPAAVLPRRATARRRRARDCSDHAAPGGS